VKRAALIGLILGALAIAPVASAVVMSTDSVSGGSSGIQASKAGPATQAVILRSRGLSKYYARSGNPLTQPVPLTGKALSAFYDTGAVTSSQPEVPLTGKALADYYDTGAVATPTDTLGGTTTTTATTSSGDSLDINWNAVVGATLIGLLLIGMSAAAVNKRRHSLSF